MDFKAYNNQPKITPTNSIGIITTSKINEQKHTPYKHQNQCVNNEQKKRTFHHRIFVTIILGNKHHLQIIIYRIKQQIKLPTILVVL